MTISDAVLTHVVNVVPSLVVIPGAVDWDHHSDWEALVIVRGAHQLAFDDGSTWQGGVGDGVIIPPQLQHRMVGERDLSLAMMVVQWRHWDPTGSWCGIKDQAGRLLMLSTWLAATPFELLAYRRHLFGAFCEELQLRLRDGVGAADPIDGLRRVIERIPEHPLDAAQLAASVHLSIKQMNRRFSERYACTPVQYLQRVRVDKACHLMRASRLPNAEIARRVGLSSPAHLSRLVKKIMGKSPRELRKGWR